MNGACFCVKREGFSAGVYNLHCSDSMKFIFSDFDIYKMHKNASVGLTDASSVKVPFYNIIHSVPAVSKIVPITDFTVKDSCRKTAAKINVITTLILSMGTTLETSPN